MATTTLFAKLTCFISDQLQLVLTMHGEGKQRSLLSPQSVNQQLNKNASPVL